MLPAGSISSAYRKPHTGWQHRAVLNGGMTYNKYRTRARATPRRIRWITLGAGLLVVIAAVAAALGFQGCQPLVSSTIHVPRSEHHDALGEALPSTVWPAQGQAAVQVGESQVQAGPNQHAAPIASVAKVMTAYLVLRDHPLGPDEDGPTITLTDADVADTDHRRGRQESVVSIAGSAAMSVTHENFSRNAFRVLANANDICLILNSSVNSYRRLDPHFEAPNQIKASAINRGAMVRIPLANEKSARIEVRSISPDANPCCPCSNRKSPGSVPTRTRVPSTTTRQAEPGGPDRD